jgi:phage host-nuclease inhibitor protein Gam
MTNYESLFQEAMADNDSGTDDIIKKIEDEYKMLRGNPEIEELNTKLIDLKKQLHRYKNNKNVNKANLNDSLAAKRKRIREEIAEVNKRLTELKQPPS